MNSPMVGSPMIAMGGSRNSAIISTLVVGLMVAMLMV